MRHKDEETKIAIKEYAEKYAAEHFGKTPALRDIANKIGMTYPSISRYLQEMDAEGMVRYDGAVIHTEKIDQLMLPSLIVTDGSRGLGNNSLRITFILSGLNIPISSCRRASLAEES